MLHIKKVAVGISGGVDSAVAALLLKKKGYDVHGIFMLNWDIADEKGRCSADTDYKDACMVCDKLDIKLHRVNFVKPYWHEVFCNLIQEYQSGCTPNPDILCNRKIKFHHFLNFAKNELKADAIATGHYAKSSFGPYLEHFHNNGDVRLLRAKDRKKDQTFFLCQISQEALRWTMFPIGDFTKQEVKHIASQNGLTKIVERKESMGICFIGSRNFQDFIKEYIEDKPGDFVNIDNGKVVGRHRGIHQWTIGQRTRLQGQPEAFFTAVKDYHTNTIYVARGTKHPILYSRTVFTSKPHWIAGEPEELKTSNVLECEFKFQHTEKWVNCQVYKINGGLLIALNQPKRALTPGQYAVLCKNNECLGSARILNVGATMFSLDYLKHIPTYEEIVKQVEERTRPPHKKEAPFQETNIHYKQDVLHIKERISSVQ